MHVCMYVCRSLPALFVSWLVLYLDIQNGIATFAFFVCSFLGQRLTVEMAAGWSGI